MLLKKSLTEQVRSHLEELSTESTVCKTLVQGYGTGRLLESANEVFIIVGASLCSHVRLYPYGPIAKRAARLHVPYREPMYAFTALRAGT
jgi:hypothetical protein